MPINVGYDSTPGTVLRANYAMGRMLGQSRIGQQQFENIQDQAALRQRGQMIAQGERRLDQGELEYLDARDAAGLEAGTSAFTPSQNELRARLLDQYAQEELSPDLDDADREDVLGQIGEQLRKIRPLPSMGRERPSLQQQFEQDTLVRPGGMRYQFDREKGTWELDQGYKFEQEQRTDVMKLRADHIKAMASATEGTVNSAKLAKEAAELFPFGGGGAEGAAAPAAGETFHDPKFGPLSGGGGGFDAFYQNWSQKSGISPDPDDPQHKYDYRAAYAAGARPKPGEHWPSEFKAQDHPNRFVDGVDTITGEPAAQSVAPLELSGESLQDAETFTPPQPGQPVPRPDLMKFKTVDERKAAYNQWQQDVAEQKEQQRRYEEYKKDPGKVQRRHAGDVKMRRELAAGKAEIKPQQKGAPLSPAMQSIQSEVKQMEHEMASLIEMKNAGIATPADEFKLQHLMDRRQAFLNNYKRLKEKRK